MMSDTLESVIKLSCEVLTSSRSEVRGQQLDLLSVLLRPNRGSRTNRETMSFVFWMFCPLFVLQKV